MESPAPSRENLWVNLICNVGLPTLVLTKLSGEHALGPVWSLVVALAFPVGYGIYDFAKRRRANFVSILGFVSVLCTGGLGLLKASALWFAVKDAAIPALIGGAVLTSLRSKTPLVREFFYNEQIIDVPRVDAALVERGQMPAFNRLLARSSVWLALAFLVSSVLNFFLARHLLKSPPGTPAFNDELGHMHALSWPVVALPCMAVMMFAIWRLISGLGTLTGLTTDEIFRAPEPKKSA